MKQIVCIFLFIDKIQYKSNQVKMVEHITHLKSYQRLTMDLVYSNEKKTPDINILNHILPFINIVAGFSGKYKYYCKCIVAALKLQCNVNNVINFQIKLNEV